MFLRKIKDIEIENKEINITRKLNLNVEKIEKQINNISYTRPSGSKNVKEEQAKLPPFIQVFYFLFFAYSEIPSEEKFWKTYLEWTKTKIDKGLIKIENELYSAEKIRNRLKRTYPSLIRDLHFLFLIEESDKFDTVNYSLHRDYYKGLDLRVISEDKEAFVSVYIDTKRGEKFKNKKKNRHNYEGVPEIKLNVKPHTLNTDNDIWLLNETHLKKLKIEFENL